MSIRWADAPSRSDAPRQAIQVFHTPRHYTRQVPAFVRLLGPWRTVWLHPKVGPRKRSAPCRNPAETCPYCPSPSEIHGYAPAALWRRDMGNTQEGWVPIVCGIPDVMVFQYQDKPVDGLAVQFWRDKVADGWKMCWQICERTVKNLPFAAFDVMPILLYWWGIHEKQDALEERNRQQAWREDLAELVDRAGQPTAPPRPTAPPPPATPNGAPPRPPRPAKPTAASPAEIREIMARANVLPFQRGVEAAIEAATADDVPEVPKAAKRPRRGRKGGA